MNTDAVAIYQIVAKVLENHRRCFRPDEGAAFCSCNKWWYPDKGLAGFEWHEHAAQQVAYALSEKVRFK